MNKEDNAGKAIYCQNCTYIRDGLLLHQVLGSITNDGRVVIKRAHNLTTILKTVEFTIECLCGYTMDVSLRNPRLKQTDTYETL